MTEFKWGDECGADGNGAEDWIANWFFNFDVGSVIYYIYIETFTVSNVAFHVPTIKAVQ